MHRYEFVITNQKEKNLLSKIDEYYSFESSKDLKITEIDKKSLWEYEPQGRFSFFISPNLNDSLNVPYIDKYLFSDSSLKVAVGNYVSSHLYLNSIRSNNPRRTFQFLYFLSNRFSEHFYKFLESILDAQLEYLVQDLGMINHVVVKNWSSRGMQRYLSSLVSKGRLYLSLVSTEKRDFLKGVEDESVIYNQRKGDDVLLNFLYYEKDNYHLSSEIEKYYMTDIEDEGDSAGWDEDVDVTEMSDEAFLAYLDNSNTSQLGEVVDEEDDYFW